MTSIRAQPIVCMRRHICGPPGKLLRLCALRYIPNPFVMLVYVTCRYQAGEDPHPEVVHGVQGPYYTGGL